MGASAARKTLWVELGIEGYLEIWDLQRELWELRISREIPDVVLVVEHLPCITWGGGARPEHILAEQYELDQAGIPVHGTDRGGGVSYHGPGQVVIYPILDLGDYGRDVHVHVRRLEEVMIRVSAAVVSEIEDGIDDHLAGSVIADTTPTIRAVDRDTRLVQLILFSENVFRTGPAAPSDAR